MGIYRWRKMPGWFMLRGRSDTNCRDADGAETGAKLSSAKRKGPSESAPGQWKSSPSAAEAVLLSRAYVAATRQKASGRKSAKAATYKPDQFLGILRKRGGMNRAGRDVGGT